MTEQAAASSLPPSSALRVPKELRRNRPFLLMLASTVVSTLGDWGGFLAIIALTSEIMGPTRAAAFAVSGVMVARVVPSLLLGPVAGVFVDRWNRKRVLVFTHLGRGAVLALIPFTSEVLTLVLATLVLEVMSALFAPAKDAVFPNLVRPVSLVQANQLNLIATYGTLPLGGLVYTGLIWVAERSAQVVPFFDERAVALPLWFNAFTFWCAAVLLVALPSGLVARKVTPVTSGVWEQFKEGARFLGTEPVIRVFIVGVMVAAAGAGVVITAGEFFARMLNAGPGGYGVLVTLVGLGLVLGFMLARPLTERLQAERVFAPGLGLAGLGLTVTALAANLNAAAVPAVVMGAGAGMVFVVGYTVLQQRASDHLRGRIFGAFNAGVRLSIFGSAVAVPFVIGVLGRERRFLVESADGVFELLYPYSFGGVRLTVLGAGVFSLAGAVLIGTVIERTLAVERRGGLSGASVRAGRVRTGVFVAFEGGDGAGKSTQVGLLADALRRDGQDVLVTREPGGTPLGDTLRHTLLTLEGDAPTAKAEALLYAAARAQHVEQVIVPALKKGTVVLTDRFVDSSIAYQGAGRGLGDQAVRDVNSFATGGVTPDLVVLLDTDVAAGLRRAADIDTPDRIESAELTFHQRTRDAFLRCANAEPGRYLVLDAALDVDTLHQIILSRVRGLCGSSHPNGSTAGM